MFASIETRGDHYIISDAAGLQYGPSFTTRTAAEHWCFTHSISLCHDDIYEALTEL